MEHRNYQRKDVWVDARVWLRTGASLPAFILNVGGEGAYLECEGLENSPCHRVEIEFLSAVGGSVERYRWPALIVHRSVAGIGVLFLVPEAESVPVLRAMAQAAETSLTAERAGDGKVLALRRKRAVGEGRGAGPTRDANVGIGLDKGLASG